jgi:zinc transport system ATP-binding protein
VLKDITFKIKKGDYVAVVGPNGAGKTTLIKAILGLNSSRAENFELDFKRVGYLQQRVSIGDIKFPQTVLETVMAGLIAEKKFPRIFNRSDKKKVLNILEMMGISEISEKLIGKLSGGQLQKVLLCRAIVNYPDILFLDEPTSALDSASRENFYALINRLNKEYGMTIVYVTHDIVSIKNFANKVLYLDGVVKYFGPSEKFNIDSLHLCGGVH